MAGYNTMAMGGNLDFEGMYFLEYRVNRDEILGIAFKVPYKGCVKTTGAQNICIKSYKENCNPLLKAISRKNLVGKFLM